MKKNSTYKNNIIPMNIKIICLILIGFCVSTCTVEIPEAPIVQIIKMQSINITSEKNELKIGETLQISKKITPVDTTNPTTYFEIIEGKAFADIDISSGIIKPKGNGKITIKAKNINPTTKINTENMLESNTLDITISGFINSIDLKVEGIDDENPTFKSPEQTMQLLLTINPTNVGGLDPYKQVLWFSIPDNVVEISESGLLKSLSSDIEKVTVTAISKADPSKFASILFKIDKMVIPLKSVKIIPPSGGANINKAGGFLTLAVTKDPPLATSSLKWSLVPEDSKILELRSSGYVAGRINGTVKVKVTSSDNENLTDEIEFTVTNQIVPNQIEISRNKDHLNTKASVGGINKELSSIFDVKILPENTIEKSVSWSIIGNHATVSKTGTLIPVSAGTVQVKVVSILLDTVTSNVLDFTILPETFPASINLSRKPDQANTVLGILDSSIDLNTVFNITFLPDNVTNKSIVWKVDGVAAEVTPRGIISPKDVGIVNVTVTSVSKTTITSRPLPFAIVQNSVTKITLKRIDENNIKGIIDKNIDLNTVFKPIIEPENATYKTVNWLVSGNATVTNEGILTPLEIGDVQITVTSTSEKSISSAPVLFTVAPLQASKITLARKQGQEKRFGIVGGATLNLNNLFNIVFEPIKTSDKSVTWSLVETTGATVTPQGILTPIQEGTVYLIVTSVATNTVSSTQKAVIIKAAPSVRVTSLMLVKKPDVQKTVTAGEAPVNMNEIFDVVISPNNATYSDVVWSLTGDAATIDVSGILTPLNAGKVQLKVTSISNENIASMPVDYDITGVPVRSIKLERKGGQSNTNAFVNNPDVDLKEVFNIILEPTNTTEIDFEWSIEGSTDLVSITPQGLLKPLKAGDVQVKITSTQSNISSAPVKFTISFIPMTSISLTKKVGIKFPILDRNVNDGVNHVNDLNNIFQVTVTPRNASAIPTWSYAKATKSSKTKNIVGDLDDKNGLITTTRTGSTFVTVESSTDSTIKSESLVVSFKNKTDRFGSSTKAYERYVLNDERLPTFYKSDKVITIMQGLVDNNILITKDNLYQIRFHNKYTRAADGLVDYILIHTTESETGGHIRCKVLFEYNDGHLIIKPNGYLVDSAPKNDDIAEKLKPLINVLFDSQGWDAFNIGPVRQLNQSTSSSILYFFQSKADPDVFFVLW